MSQEAMIEDEYLSDEAIKSLDLANLREELKATAQALAGLAETIQDDMTPAQARYLKPIMRALAIDLGKSISEMADLIQWDLLDGYVVDVEAMQYGGDYGFCLKPVKP